MVILTGTIDCQKTSTMRSSLKTGLRELFTRRREENMKIGQRIAPPSLLQGGSKASLCRAWLLIGMIVLLTAGCSPSGGRGISVYNDGKVHSVVASVGEKIEITLQTVGPGEYGDPIVSSGSVRFLGETPEEIQNPGGARQI